MSARHAVRGALSAWLGLIVLQAVVRPGGAVDTGRFGGLISDASGLLTRALSANVAAIPDRRTGAATGSNYSQPGYITPDQVKAGADTAATSDALGALTGRDGPLSLPGLGQYAAGGMPTGIYGNPALLDPASHPIPTTLGFGQVNARAVR